MAKAHFVKSARKDNPVAKKGESYWWWKPMIGGRGGPKRFSKERPKPSQLTNSEFLSAVYGAQESLDEAKDADAFRTVAEEVRELGEETQGKYDNMPEGLQQGDTGQMLEERASQCSEWADQIESAADTLAEKMDERATLRQAWADYDSAMEEYDEDGDEDGDEDEPEEPDEDRPDDNDDDLIEEALGECPSPF